jgi:hypothetical protein
MKYEKKIELARTLVLEDRSCVAEGAGRVYLYAYTKPEEQRLRDLVAERKLDFIVKLTGRPSMV